MLQSNSPVCKPSGIACPVCESGSVESRYSNLSKCDGCDHVFQTDLRVGVSYDARYAYKYDHFPTRPMSVLRWDLIQECLSLPAGSRILDIGYGNGAFLKHAQSAGMDIFGIDVHGEDFGIPAADYGDNASFDLICFFDSLEHFSDFENLRELRAPHVAISIPNRPGFLLDRPEAWRHYRPGEHLRYFSPGSLDRFMVARSFTRKRFEGYPEDAIRGKLRIGTDVFDNIYTAIYSRGEGLRDSVDTGGG